MAKFGCPPRFIAVVRQFHDGMQARVQNDGEFSESCCAVLWHQHWFPNQVSFDGNLFNLRRLQAKTKEQTDDFLYADGMNKNASSETQNAKGHGSRSFTFM